MSLADVQTLVLRPPKGKAVAHLMLRVSCGQGSKALQDLKRLFCTKEADGSASQHSEAADLDGVQISFGADAPTADQVQCSLGFTWHGLQALCVPPAYLRIFSRLAPAFAQGAPLRGARLGDSGKSAPAHWETAFGLEQAHVLLTLHGPEASVHRLSLSLEARWPARPEQPKCPGALACVRRWRGRRLGAPPNQDGEWLHFGYRDGLTDHRIEGLKRRAGAPCKSRPEDLPQTTEHRAGEFVLGHANDSGFNVFGLPLAPENVRSFFTDSSFGVLRPLEQDVARFERQVKTWRTEAPLGVGAGAPSQLDADKAREAWVKAKLCGRWPTGEALRPGQIKPGDEDFKVDFAADDAGTGCPWAAHVRRMRSDGQTGDAHQRQRPLLRRGMAFGRAVWETDAVTKFDEAAHSAVLSLPAGSTESGSPPSEQAEQRGLLGLFFCASLEDQFEHLLGQWANRRPLGAPDDSTNKDPLIGSHEDANAFMSLPQEGATPKRLTGFAPWTTTLGTAYAWHPSRKAQQILLKQDYVKPENKGPWL